MERLPSGSYRAVLNLGHDPATGKKVRDSQTFRTRTEALRWLAGRRGEVDGGRASVGGRVPLGDWLDRWLVQKAGQVEPASLRWYRQAADRHVRPHLGPVRLSDLTADHVQSWHADLTKAGTSAAEQHKAATTLRAALQDAVRLGLLAANVAKRVKRPKVRRKEAVPYTLGEAGRLIDHAAGWFRAFVLVGLDTGARPGELVALHWADVDLAADAPACRFRQSFDERADPPALKPPKTPKGDRTLLLGTPAADALAALPRRGPLVFPASRGGFLCQSNLSARWWRPLVGRAGVPKLGLYSLRHTCATQLLAAGVNVKVVSERLGHADIAVTLRFYSHAIPNLQSHAAEVCSRLWFRFRPPHGGPTDPA